MQSLYKYDQVPFHVNIGTSFSSISVGKILVIKPDLTEAEWDASLVSSSLLYYATSSTDLDQTGEYIGQSYIEASGVKKKGKAFTFVVNDDYDNQ